MKRKLICVSFMLAGAAVIAGAILLSRGRSDHADASPVYMLIIVSIVTIIAAAFHINEPGVPEVSGREKVFLRVFHVIGILAILVSIAFIVIMFFITRQYTDWMQNIFILMVLAAAGIIVAALSLKVRPPFIARDIAKSVAALVIASALCFIYLNYMPKYSVDDGINTLRSAEELSQKDVYYPTSPKAPNWWVIRGTQISDITTDGKTYYDVNHVKSFGGNPFYIELYEYSCDSYSCDAEGLHITKGYILFNPATGAYEYMRTQEQDETYSPEELPEFDWNFIYDEGGQRDAVFNLYFRAWPNAGTYAAQRSPKFSAGSGEWDVKLKEVMYPHNLPESEALFFLRSIGEEALKAKLLEQIRGNLTVEVYFYGIDIATYKDGQIILKL